MAITANSNITWVEKYRPKSIKEMALPTAKVGGHKVDLTEELRRFLVDFFKEKRKIKIDFIFVIIKIIYKKIINNLVQMFPLLSMSNNKEEKE